MSAGVDYLKEIENKKISASNNISFQDNKNNSDDEPISHSSELDRNVSVIVGLICFVHIY
jgi:hypothetical protein